MRRSARKGGRPIPDETASFQVPPNHRRARPFGWCWGFPRGMLGGPRAPAGCALAGRRALLCSARPSSPERPAGRQRATPLARASAAHRAAAPPDGDSLEMTGICRRSAWKSPVPEIASVGHPRKALRGPAAAHRTVRLYPSPTWRGGGLQGRQGQPPRAPFKFAAILATCARGPHLWPQCACDFGHVGRVLHPNRYQAINYFRGWPEKDLEPCLFHFFFFSSHIF